MPTPGVARSMLLLALAAALPPSAGAQSLPTAAQVAARIGTGWNIGNTMEVPGGETGWGNPAVTQRLVDGVKAAGFNAVRIPCAWDSHANATTHEIDAAWLARVKQVVDYCLKNGMYVVLNIHWDGGWLENHVQYADQAAVNVKQKAYWTQIAQYFKAYDEHLLFAGTNEVHQDYGTPTAENIAVQQSYNQTFVDAVRATGANNATRPLVVQTYNTNIGHGLSFFTPPKDTATDRLIVEVHYYDPWDYTGNENGGCLYWGSPYPAQSACAWAQESYVDDQMSKVKAKWVDRGFPVIVGEYGPVRRTSLSGQQLADHLASRRYYLKVLNAAASRNGIKTFYWDNGVFNQGGQIFDRSTGAVSDQGAVDAIMQGAGVPPPAATYALAVTTAGTGGGMVVSSPAGIACGTTCRASFASGASVALTPAAAPGSTFVGWSGDCSGAGACTLALSAARSVTATFDVAGSSSGATSSGGTSSGTTSSGGTSSGGTSSGGATSGGGTSGGGTSSGGSSSGGSSSGATSSGATSSGATSSGGTSGAGTSPEPQGAATSLAGGCSTGGAGMPLALPGLVALAARRRRAP